MYFLCESYCKRWKLVKTNKQNQQTVTGKKYYFEKRSIFNSLLSIFTKFQSVGYKKTCGAADPHGSADFFWRKKRSYLSKVGRLVATYCLRIDTTDLRSLWHNSFPQRTQSVSTCILDMRKVRPGRGRWYVQGHRVNQTQKWEWIHLLRPNQDP